MAQNSWDLVEQKIAEALRKTGGNELRARQLIAATALDNPELLKALAKPHLTGITAHAISHVLRAKKSSLQDGGSQSHQEEEGFGMDILKSFASGDAPQFGQEQYAAPTKRKGVSPSHIAAIQQIVQKSQTEK